jgi:hypothetical protein
MHVERLAWIRNGYVTPLAPYTRFCTRRSRISGDIAYIPRLALTRIVHSDSTRQSHRIEQVHLGLEQRESCGALTTPNSLEYI